MVWPVGLSPFTWRSSRVVDKIKSGQAVIRARPNWLNGSPIIHSWAGMPSRESRSLLARYAPHQFAILSHLITTLLIIRN